MIISKFIRTCTVIDTFKMENMNQVYFPYAMKVYFVYKKTA